MDIAYQTHIDRFREQAVGYQREEGVGEGVKWGWRLRGANHCA